jgi:hypothetical protein
MNSSSLHLPPQRPPYSTDQDPQNSRTRGIRNSKNHLLSGLKPPASR